MPTIIDNATKFTYCPFCREPGRLMARNFVNKDDKRYFKYAIGCVNKRCFVKPRTKWVSALKQKPEDAIDMAKHIWNRRV